MNHLYNTLAELYQAAGQEAIVLRDRIADLEYERDILRADLREAIEKNRQLVRALRRARQGLDPAM